MYRPISDIYPVVSCCVLFSSYKHVKRGTYLFNSSISHYTQLTFMGYLLSERVISPPNTKGKGPRKTQEKQNIRQTFAALMNLTRFIADLSTAAEPQQQLTRKSATFTWTKVHEEPYSKFKIQLVNVTSLVHLLYNGKSLLLHKIYSTLEPPMIRNMNKML